MKKSNGLRLVYWFARRKFGMAVVLILYYVAAERFGWSVPHAQWVFASAGLFVIPEGLADVLRALKGDGESLYGPGGVAAPPETPTVELTEDFEETEDTFV